MIAIIDYHLGNPNSIRNMLRRVGAEGVVTSRADEIARAEKLILPGVGAFDSGIRNLRELGLVPVLHDRVLEQGVPILGICLGMQLFTRESEEGREAGLGWLDARTVRFRIDRASSRRKLPHMGWNHVHPRRSHPLFREMFDEPRFYFVHTYHVECADAADVWCTTRYEYEFTSAVARGNIVGTQFHPEKSHKFGMKLLHEFASKPTGRAPWDMEATHDHPRQPTTHTP